MRTIAQFDKLIPPDRLRAAQDYFASSVRWQYGWPQGTKDPFSHWSMDFLKSRLDNQEDLEDKLYANEEFKPLADIWDILKSGPMHGHHLVRCYANAHTFGVEGYLHTDSPKPNNYTAVIYLNPVWKPDWAGELILFDEARDSFYAVLPKPGRVALIPGDVLHAARAVSRSCPAIRVSLAFKSRIPS
ncbi:MAG TPA: 2OG-Fe(II) oxygenase [Burkholderiales bacterium]|nr:2OG-Fe(II) oxygenase [Burkholderiales bacterium]